MHRRINVSVTTGFRSDAEGSGGREDERRAVPRYPLVAEIELFDPVERIRLTATISEIGAHGCYIRLPDPLKQHTVVQLVIQKHGESFKSWGMVVYAHEGRGMGINFFRPEPSQVKVLQSWIDDLRVQRQTR
jgi:hypothetical protein